MVDVLEGMMTQTAVYWGNPRNSGAGTKVFDAPVEIKCRWSDKKGLISVVTNKLTETIASNGVVHVLQDVDELGFLYLGTLTGMTEAQKANPKLVSGAYEIKQFSKVPSVDGAVFVRKAYLGFKV